MSDPTTFPQKIVGVIDKYESRPSKNYPNLILHYYEIEGETFSSKNDLGYGKGDRVVLYYEQNGKWKNIVSTVLSVNEATSSEEAIEEDTSKILKEDPPTQVQCDSVLVGSAGLMAHAQMIHEHEKYDAYGAESYDRALLELTRRFQKVLVEAQKNG